MATTGYCSPTTHYLPSAIPDGFFNPLVALGYLHLVGLVQLEGLSQLEEVLISPSPLQRSRDGRLVIFYTLLGETPPAESHCVVHRGWPR